MVIKSRIIMVTTILVMACMVWLLGENRAYKAQYEKQQAREAELVDKYFNLRVDYDVLFDAIHFMEEEMDTILDYTHDLEMKLINKK